MRLFIAVELGKEVQAYLSELQEKFKPLINGTFTKDFHLTLKFLDEVSPEKAAETEKRLKKLRFNRFNAELTHIGTFPNNKEQARVLWVGLSPEDIIIHLQLAIEKELRGLFEKDFNFNPHITLARIKEVKNKTVFETNTTMPVKPLKININKISLIRSELTNLGATYTTINEFDLS